MLLNVKRPSFSASLMKYGTGNLIEHLNEVLLILQNCLTHLMQGGNRFKISNEIKLNIN